MGKSFVLKDKAGRPGGYLLESNGNVCCRAGAERQRARLVALFSDGTQESYTIESGGAEQSWPCGTRMLCGGYVCADGELLLSSGDEARSAFERSRMHPPPQSREERTAPLPPRGEQEPKARMKEENEVRRERRWPPPPCWPRARYAHGVWRDPKEE